MTKAWIPPILIAFLAAAAVAFMGATLTTIGPWYQSLAKPDWTPPDYAFGLIWTIVFFCTALSAVFTWRNLPTNKKAETMIGLYAINGALNIVWSLLFFRMERPDWAFIELVFLWLSILALILFSRKYSTVGALLLLPYIVWVTIAGALNWQVLALNGPFG